MYLNGFCRDNKLWVYDRVKKEHRQQAPINTGLIQYYYSQQKEDGSFDTSMESILSWLESKVAPIITKIDNTSQTSDEENGFLSVFIAFLITRIPGFEKLLDAMLENTAKMMMAVRTSSEELVQRSIKSYKEDTGNDITRQDMMDIVEGKYKITAHRNYRIRSMIEVSQPLAEILIGKAWHFMHASKRKSFVTSDNPVTLIPPPDYNPSGFYGIGFGTPGVVIATPLSQKTCLIMTDGDSIIRFGQAQDDYVRRINLIIANSCERFLMARDRELLESLVTRTRIYCKSPVPKFKITNL